MHQMLALYLYQPRIDIMAGLSHPSSHNSLSLSSPTAQHLLRQNTRTEKDGQKICMVVNTRNIKPILFRELEQFEKAFINQLDRILEKFEAANLSDQLHPSSQDINKPYKL